jgi:hypothetical protein
MVLSLMRAIQLGVPYGRGNRPMPQKILDHSYIDPFVDQNVTATVPQHMRVQLQVL